MPRLDISSLHLTRPQHHALNTLADSAAKYAHLMTRSLSEPASLTERDSSSSESCGPDNNSARCQKPTTSGNSSTLTIVLGAVIPITAALVVLLFLHRRLVKKRRQEDANDKYKSLDFGDGMVVSSKAGKGGKGVPEMSVTDLGGDFQMNGTRRPRGMSMDMGSPYLLPGALNGSRESMHSMSRTLHDEHDPYRPVTAMKGDSESSRSFPRTKSGFETASMYSTSTGFGSTNENAKLVSNAQRMSRTYPKRGDSTSPHHSNTSPELPPLPSDAYKSRPPSRKQSLAAPEQPLRDISEASPAQENFPIPPIPPQKEALPPPRTSSVGSRPRPPRKASMPSQQAIDTNATHESSIYGDSNTSPPVPHGHESTYDIDPSMIYTGRSSVDAPAEQGFLHQPQPQNNRLSVLGLRPLPPDNPEDNPEQRANRIRSFYKEYFDSGKGGQGAYEDELDSDFLAGGAIYDPETGAFVTGASKPWNHNVGRRAMTPPPRGAPRNSGRSSGPGPHRRHLSTGARGRIPQPKKKLPPPMPLLGLGTPHLLRDDSAIFNAADFAPPTSFREIQNGRRPDSPMGGARPYSPALRAHTPVVSSFAELKPMPSPHELRKSSTFTALDFAPPKFRGHEGASDAGSIRSNRSGISAMQSQAIRDGAYRVSRIPKEMVSTRNDLMTQLKPTWDMRDRAPLS